MGAREPRRAPAPPPRRRRRLGWWILITGLVALIAIGGGLIAGIAVTKHRQTGQWQVPDFEDVAKVVAPPSPPPVSKIIFLDRRGGLFLPGEDDAARGSSGVVAFHHPKGPVTMPGWKGSDAAWKKMRACVQAQFAPFDVVVTDELPAGIDFIRVAVGGKPKDLGIAERTVTGMAPFNGLVIPRAVVFAFAAQVTNDPRTVCETVAMEVAHAYGLDHEFLCKDVMTYLSCGKRTFVDQDAPCGEKKKRACQGGAATQNSYRRLLAALGPAARPAK
jgi:hypothetical protein